MSDDDVARSLIDALASDAEHVDDGGFTIDSTAAYEKLREHQLSDPHGYLLLLVEAAWLAADDRDRVGVHIDLGVITLVEFSGLALPRDSLPELFTAALGSVAKLEGVALRRARILQLLGLAANNALALGPRRIIIEASDAQGETQRVSIDPRGVLTVEPASALPPGKIRFRFCGFLWVFNRIQAERALLEQRCAHTRLQILVDDRLVSQRALVQRDGAKPTANKPSWAPVTLDGREIGILGPPRDPDTPRHTLVVNRGISFIDSTVNLGLLQTVVEVDLPVDLSRSKLVEGPELAAVRQAIHHAQSQVAEPVRTKPLVVPQTLGEQRAKRQLLALLVVGSIGLIIALVADAWRKAPRIEPFAPRCEGRECEPLGQPQKPPSHAPRPPGLSTEELAAQEAQHRQRCVPEDSTGCERYVELVRARVTQADDRDPLRRALVRSCHYANLGPACLEAAWYYHYGFIVDDEVDDLPETSEAALLGRACGAGVARACNLAHATPLRQDCERGYALACYALGLAGYDADSQSSNDVISREGLMMLERSCEGELVEGCYAAGVARFRGLAGTEDLDAAEHWFSRGCSRRHEPSCAAARLIGTGGPGDVELAFPNKTAPHGAVAWMP